MARRWSECLAPSLLRAKGGPDFHKTYAGRAREHPAHEEPAVQWVREYQVRYRPKSRAFVVAIPSWNETASITALQGCLQHGIVLEGALHRIMLHPSFAEGTPMRFMATAKMIEILRKPTRQEVLDGNAMTVMLELQVPPKYYAGDPSDSHAKRSARN